MSYSRWYKVKFCLKAFSQRKYYLIANSKRLHNQCIINVILNYSWHLIGEADRIHKKQTVDENNKRVILEHEERKRVNIIITSMDTSFMVTVHAKKYCIYSGPRYNIIIIDRNNNIKNFFLS